MQALKEGAKGGVDRKLRRSPVTDIDSLEPRKPRNGRKAVAGRTAKSSRKEKSEGVQAKIQLFRREKRRSVPAAARDNQAANLGQIVPAVNKDPRKPARTCRKHAVVRGQGAENAPKPKSRHPPPDSADCMNLSHCFVS